MAQKEIAILFAWYYNLCSFIAYTNLMKKTLLFPFAILALNSASAQITITDADMPVSGDTLRYSFANITGTSFNAADSGVSKTWDFSSLVSIGQNIDTFKKASAVNISYALTISPTAYGYKVADSFPGLSSSIPITINNVYTFFNKKTSPSRYVAEGFAAVISGIPTPANYSDEDEWYYFPLTYTRTDSSTFSLKFSIPSLFSVKQAGYRKTRADGWGTIKTPYFTTPVNCLRVRSEIVEVDSFEVATLKIGVPRTTVEYKFLANGEHYPAVWVTATKIGSTETVSNIRYRDNYKTTSAVITPAKSAFQSIKTYPNPLGNSAVLNVEIPQSFGHYAVEIFDIRGRLLQQSFDSDTINVSDLAKGQYLLRVSSGTETGIAVFTK
jgi:hypothetical protein